MKMNLSDDFIREITEKFKKILKKYKKWIYDKNYKKKNRLKININAKKYYYKNKDKISKNHGIYRKNNKEKINNYLKNYNEIYIY